jgi:hypothetical protein
MTLSGKIIVNPRKISQVRESKAEVITYQTPSHPCPNLHTVLLRARTSDSHFTDEVNKNYTE